MPVFVVRIIFIQCLLLLSAFFYLMGHGLAMEGLPSGTFCKSRDVSGYNFKRLIELSKKNMRAFDRIQPVIEVMGRSESLKLGRDYFIEVDIDALRASYLNQVRGRNWLFHIRDFFLLSYVRNSFDLEYRLDLKKTLRGLNRRFANREKPQYRVNQGQLVKTSWTPDFDNIIKALNAKLFHGTQGRFSIAGGWGSREEVIQEQAKFEYKLLSTKIPINQEQRGYWILSELLLDKLDVILNPGDRFSFLSWIAARKIELEDFQSPYLNVEGILWNDFFGLELMASKLFEMILQLDLEIDTHHHHTYFLPKISHVQPGMDVALGNGQDFIFRNSFDQPIRLEFNLDAPYDQIRMSISSCLEGPKPGQVVEAFRRVEYADMETIIDSSLPRGEKLLDRKPLSGLSVGFYRVSNINGKRRKELIDSVQYSSQAGRIRMGSGAVNVFHPDSWRELGLEEVYGHRD